MILHCAICDDAPKEAQIAKSKIEYILKKHNISCEISLYTNSKQLLFDLDESRPFDLLVIDVEMPLVSGVELAKAAKRIYKNCLIIFLTSHLNYAVDGYEMDIFRFVPKDQIEERLERSICDAVKIITTDFQKSYIVRKHDLFVKIYYNDIFYITKDGKNSIIHLGNKEYIKVRKALSTVFEELNSDEFVYIERGCIANMSNVLKVSNREWICENGEKLMMSSAAYTAIKQKLLTFWSKNIVD